MKSNQWGRWLSLSDAVRYCPYGKKKLIELIKNNQIKGGQMNGNKNGWFVDRVSLDQYMDSQCQPDEIAKKVVAYLNQVN